MPNTRVPATGEALPVVSQKREHPWVKARRLARELSETLAECGDCAMAEVYPKSGKAKFPVYFWNETDPESELRRYARGFAAAAQKIDPEATQCGIFRGESCNPTRFAVFVSTKEGRE